MIKLRNQIDLKEAAEFLGLTANDIEQMLYDLAGDNKIMGSFKDNVFFIESDTDQLIALLEKSFDDWQHQKVKK